MVLLGEGLSVPQIRKMFMMAVEPRLSYSFNAVQNTDVWMQGLGNEASIGHASSSMADFVFWKLLTRSNIVRRASGACRRADLLRAEGGRGLNSSPTSLPSSSDHTISP